MGEKTKPKPATLPSPSKNQIWFTWVFGFLLFGLVAWIIAFAPNEMPETKQRIIAVVCAIISGLFAFFFSGNFELGLKSFKLNLGVTKINFSGKAVGGFAVFVFVLIWWLTPLAPIGKSGTEEIRKEIRNGAKETQTHVTNEINRLLAEIKNPYREKVMCELEDEFKAVKDRAFEHYEIGRNEYENRSFEKATDHFQKALEVAEIPSFYITLGNSHLAQRQYGNAIGDYNAALSLYKNNQNCESRIGEVMALYNLGTVYNEMNQTEKSIDYYQQALAVAQNGENIKDKSPHLKDTKKTYNKLDKIEKAISTTTNTFAEESAISSSTRGTIDFPQKGTVVGRRFEAEGTITNIKDNVQIWLAIKIGILYWPKESAIKHKNGKWRKEVVEGGNLPQGKFSIALLLVTNEARKKIEKWQANGLKTGKYPGLFITDLPDVEELALAEDLHIEDARKNFNKFGKIEKQMGTTIKTAGIPIMDFEGKTSYGEFAFAGPNGDGVDHDVSYKGC